MKGKQTESMNKSIELVILRAHLEKFSFEFRKTKTKTKPITIANHNKT